jgi:hypothetical protein
MGTPRVRPGGSQGFFLYFFWCEILGGIFKFLLVILRKGGRAGSWHLLPSSWTRGNSWVLILAVKQLLPDILLAIQHG